MKVKETLSEKIKNGTLHMTLIDPDKQVAEKGGKIWPRSQLTSGRMR